ncbi:MAG: hypothetical protein ACYTFH_06050, partial [Planctomycetota bacterium]
MRSRPRRPIACLAALLPAAIASVQIATPASGQDAPAAPAGTVRMPVAGGSLGGFVLPVSPLAEDLELRAARAWVWSVDDTQRLVLQGDVFVEFGSYRFRADEAVVWINRLPTAEGLVNQFAIHFDEVREPTERAGLTTGGRDLLVTGSGRGAVVLKVASLERRAAPRTPALVAAEARLAAYLRRLLAAPPPPLELRPRLDVPSPPSDRLEPGPPTAAPAEAFPELPESVLLPRPDLENVPIFRPGGVVSFTAGSTVAEPSSNSIVAEQGVIVEYVDPGFGEGRRLEMRAERAVIFTAEGAMESLREGGSAIDVSSVSGIYLEGGVVATDGEITLRASRIYYDLPRNQALAVDAVLRTYVRLRRREPVAGVGGDRLDQRVLHAASLARHAGVHRHRAARRHLGRGRARHASRRRCAVHVVSGLQGSTREHPAAGDPDRLRGRPGHGDRDPLGSAVAAGPRCPARTRGGSRPGRLHRPRRRDRHAAAMGRQRHHRQPRRLRPLREFRR